jgi:rare lipoprotein A
MNEVMVGIASWYGPGFHNKKTASGVRFDQHDMMAAHRTLPFGTLVKVTNLKNNRTCIVKITDRGPFIKNRLIDLSKAAAHELDFAHSGVAKVKLEVISDDIATTTFSTELQAHTAVQDRFLSPKLALK